jgi:hypothetical protein
MSQKAYATEQLAKIPTPSGDSISESSWKPVRHHFGIRAFGVNAFVAGSPGEAIVPEHDEIPEPGSGGQRHEELYFVSSGRAKFTVAGETIDAPTGTLVFVRPEASRAAVAVEAGTTILAIGAPAGESFRVSAWESRRLEPAAR